MVKKRQDHETLSKDTESKKGKPNNRPMRESKVDVPQLQAPGTVA